MSKDDKSAVLQAMKKLKRANRDVDDSDQNISSGNKKARNDSNDSIADKIIGAVRNLKGDD